MNKIIHGDCLEKLKELEENSVDSIVTDPPYHLVSIVKRFGKENSAPAKFGTDGAFSRASKGFMGKDWDGVNEEGIGIAQKVELWAECLRVLKPGGHLLAFSGTRTYHRMASAIEDAGFEVRDMIEWVYGSGFPKSLNIGKAVDKLQGNEREVVGESKARVINGGAGKTAAEPGSIIEYTQLKATKGNSEWEGWGTALKPSHEPICMARKPLAEKTVAENVLKYGTGGINIDESRVEAGEDHIKNATRHTNKIYRGGFNDSPINSDASPLGRFPANLLHDNSEEVRECFPETKSGGGNKATKTAETFLGTGFGGTDNSVWECDSGNASRFFKSIIYQAKASKSERTAQGTITNGHPTIKPIALMEYLIKMVTPKGGVVLDPFAGSGSTLVAAKQNGFQYIGIEREEEYIKIIEARLK